MTFIRYVLVQLIAYCIDLGGFLLLLKAEFEGPIICNVFAKVSAGVFSFVLHRSFTFREEKKLAINHQVIRYFLLLALNIPFSSALFAIALLIISESVIA